MYTEMSQEMCLCIYLVESEDVPGTLSSKLWHQGEILNKKWIVKIE